MIDRVFSGLQATAAVTIAGLTVWALLFSPLPEALITQLRVEISEAKSEVENLQREKGQLQETGSILRSKNQDLETKQRRTVSEIQVLEDNRNELRRGIKVLQKERSRYAESVVQSATAKLLALAENRLGYYKFFAEVGARYSEHTKWVEANRELAKLLPEFEATPKRELYMEPNPLFKRVRELWGQTMMLPRIWLGEPGPPLLEPIGNPMEEIIIYRGEAWTEAERLMDATKRKVELFEHYDYKVVNQYLTNFFLNNTVIGRGGAKETGSTFIKSLKDEEMLQNMLPDAASRIKSSLDYFLNSNSEIRSIKIRLAFEKEPTVNEILTEGQEVLENIRRFREKLEVLGESKR